VRGFFSASLILAAFGFWAVGGVSLRGENVLPVETIVPSQTGVLLLPPVDTEPWAKDVLAQRQFVVRRRLQYEFLSRQFKLYGETLALPAAHRAPSVDLADPTARTAANLDRLARRTGADWVVSVNVQEVKDDPASAPGPNPPPFHCHCLVKLKVWDASRRGWLAWGACLGHDEGGTSLPVFLFMESIDDAAKNAARTVVGAYPAVVPLSDIAQTSDYLAGQTEPFIGKPGVTFAGLQPK
jgi:hypothetical protein